MEKMLWIDMEMTGLDVDKERIIEVGAVVTDKDLNPLEEYESVVYQDENFLLSMDEWNKNQHKKSGLALRVPQAPKEGFVEKQICQLVERHFQKPALLCGNSIAQDRKFIHRYMKNLDSLLHYRMLDVTSWKIIMEMHFSVVYNKKDNHRALDDIKESIEELKTFIQFIKKK